MATLLYHFALIIFIHATLWYLIALKLKRNDVADIAWGLGFVWLVLYAGYFSGITYFNKLVYGSIILWGLRLSIHIGFRSFRKKEEDFRYRNWRLAWGKTFYWRTYLQVFLLQGCFQFIIALPLAIAAYSGGYFPGRDGLAAGSLLPGFYNTFVFYGILVWFTGFVFQAVGDYQLSQFVKTKKPGEIIQTGLWKYSRHPNYFGEIAMWWGTWLMVASLPLGIWAILSPITITYLLAFVSGVPMLEAKYKGNPAFEAYKKRTPALFPWWPKKEQG